MGGVLAIAGLALQVAGQVSSIQQQKASAAHAENQARLAGIEAEISRYDGQIAQGEAAYAAYEEMGRQRAAQAESGILGSATGSLLLAQSESEAQKVQSDIALQAGREQQSYLESKDSYQNSANLQEAKANSGYLGVGKSILSDVSGYLQK